MDASILLADACEFCAANRTSWTRGFCAIGCTKGFCFDDVLAWRQGVVVLSSRFRLESSLFLHISPLKRLVAFFVDVLVEVALDAVKILEVCDAASVAGFLLDQCWRILFRQGF